MSAARSFGERPGDGSWRSPLEEFLASGDRTSPDDTRQIEPAPNVIGQPERDVAYWTGPQRYQDTCAIKCQQHIIQQFKGMAPSEEELLIEAMQHGWYRPGAGTPMEHLGNLLESHGIAIKRYTRANVVNLAAELAQGHKVIVAVDSRELWETRSLLRQLNELLDNLGLADANHAIVVSAIDTRDWPNLHVIVSDPGTGKPLARYPLEQFLNAWGDSEFFMVSTKDPVPEHVPEMIHFDYAFGRLPAIANVTWDDLVLNFISQPKLFQRILFDYLGKQEPELGLDFGTDDSGQEWQGDYDLSLGDE